MSPAERASYEADMVAAALAAVTKGLGLGVTHLANAKGAEGRALREELERLWEEYGARATAAEAAAVAAEDKLGEESGQ